MSIEAPPGFRGLHPHLPIRKYVRNLPHWRQDGATYAVTFRLADSLPQVKLDELHSMRRDFQAKYPEPRSEQVWRRYVRTITGKVNLWLDEGEGECYFRQANFADALARAILHFHNQRYHIGSYVVMPNHCHLIIRPFDGHDLEDLLKSIKGVTARFVNKALERNEPIWQQESFDRIVRNEEHLYNAIQYIGNNPRNANLPRSQWFRWVDPTWQSLKWGFKDE